MCVCANSADKIQTIFFLVKQQSKRKTLTKLFTSILERSSSWILKFDEIMNFWLCFVSTVVVIMPFVFLHSLSTSSIKLLRIPFVNDIDVIVVVVIDVVDVVAAAVSF